MIAGIRHNVANIVNMEIALGGISGKQHTVRIKIDTIGRYWVLLSKFEGDVGLPAPAPLIECPNPNTAR